MDENQTNLINKTINDNIINDTLIQNTTGNKLFLDDTGSKLLFLGIILILLILLIISVLILMYLFLKKKKVNSVSNHNMILNRIILKNPNNAESLKVDSKGFQRLQNTSNVSNSNIQPNNNLFNEIKSENLKDEIHKIINTSSALDSGRRKRKKNVESESNKDNNKQEKNILQDNNNKQLSGIISEDNINNKEEKPNINTQELEKEIKEQIKKYVIEEHNI